MKEAELQDAIVDLAHMLGYIVNHTRPARTDKGWRTPGQYDANGYPDLTLVGRGRVLWAEVKGERGRLSDDQRAWYQALINNGGEAYVWYPKDWTDGTVEAILRQRL